MIPLTFCPRCWDLRPMTGTLGSGNEGRKSCEGCGGSFTEEELAEAARA